MSEQALGYWAGVCVGMAFLSTQPLPLNECSLIVTWGRQVFPHVGRVLASSQPKQNSGPVPILT